MVAVRITPEYPELIVSDDGMIMGPSRKWLRAFPDKSGYLQMNRYRDGRWSQLGVHVIVCTAFHGRRPSPTHQAAHRNGVKTDNRAINLRWVTQTENEADKIGHGTAMLGVRHHRAKLTDQDIRDIREARAAGAFLHTLADQYVVTESTISRIALRKLWRHVI